MHKISVICVGKLKEKFYIAASDEYIKRLRSFCDLEVIELEEERLSEKCSQSQINNALQKEGLKIFAKIPSNAYLISMCIEGKNFSSKNFAGYLANNVMGRYNHTVFIIGGSNGISEEVKAKSQLMLSMSSMTFPHHLARVMLLEQIYRSFQINNNGKYHK